MRPPIILAVLAVTAVAALGSARAAPTATARFLVSVRASVTKQWTYTRALTVNGCRVRVRGTGTRKIAFGSRDVSVVTARSGSRVRFSGAVGPLAVTVRQVGRKTTTTTGPTGCDDVEMATCSPLTRTFSGPRAQLTSPRRHKLSFRRIRNVVPAAFFGDCPGEPASVRAVSAGLGLATADFSERALFDRTVGGVTLSGNADGTTTLLNGSARTDHRVRWTLTLRRLGG